MIDFLSTLTAHITKAPEVLYILPAYITFLIAFIVSRDFRTKLVGFMSDVFENIFSIFTKLLYSENKEFVHKKSKLGELRFKSELMSLKQEIRDEILKGKVGAIDKEIDSYIEHNLKNKLNEKFDDISMLDGLMAAKLKRYAHEQVSEFISNIDIKKVSNSLIEAQKAEQVQHMNKALYSILENQMHNTGKMKTVMINLFVFVNVAIMCFYVFGDVVTVKSSAVYGITGLYVSLATFIIYIYRSSNFRSSVVMAIKEDSKKLNDVLDYLSQYKKGKDLNEHDIDLLRMIMTNRSEREKMSDHPYEMIVKGITDSNIQFKGGKMSLSKSPAKAKE